jgi:hypothetical protein
MVPEACIYGSNLVLDVPQEDVILFLLGIKFLQILQFFDSGNLTD